MALTERDIQLVELAGREAARTVLIESEPERKRMAREEAWRVVKEAIPAQVAVCKVAAQLRISNVKLFIVALVSGGGCGVVSNLPTILAFLQSLNP